MFNFPWSNFHELNLDWILKVVKEAKELFERGESDIQHAVETAEQALETAEQAASGVIADGSVTIPKINGDVLNLMAYVVSGSVNEVAIPEGAFVIIRKSTIANVNDGIYTAAVNIPANSIITSADLMQPVPLSDGGGLNYINDALAGVNRTIGDGVLTDFTATDLTGAANELKAGLNSLGSKAETKIKNRRFLFIGDSYNSITGVAWSTIVANILGLSDIAVVSQGGYGFVTGQNKTWLSLLQNATITDENTITDILICGGANDAWAGNDTIPAAMGAFDTYVKSRFTGLENVWVGFAGNSYKSLSEVLLMRKAMREYIKGADELNWHYLNNIETTLLYAGYIQKIEDSGVLDMLHPNVSGVRKLGKNLAKCILTGSCNNIHPGEEIVLNVNISKFSSPSTITIDEAITDNIITVRINDYTVTPTTSLAGSTAHTLATCSDLKNMLRPGISLPVNVVAGTINTTARLYFSDYNTLILLLPSGVTIAAGTPVAIKGAVFSFDDWF